MERRSTSGDVLGGLPLGDMLPPLRCVGDVGLYGSAGTGPCNAVRGDVLMSSSSSSSSSSTSSSSSAMSGTDEWLLDDATDNWSTSTDTALLCGDTELRGGELVSEVLVSLPLVFPDGMLLSDGLNDSGRRADGVVSHL